MSERFNPFKRHGGSRQRFTFDHMHPTGCARFAAVQRAVLGRAGESMTASARLAGLLIALEAIGTPSDWQAAYAAIRSRHSTGRHWRISWPSATGHQDARMLCPITVKHIEQFQEWLPFGTAREQLWTFLVRQGLYPRDCCSDQVLRDAVDWLQANVGAVFAAHTSAAARLTALPDSAWARGVHKLPLRGQPADANDDEAPEPSDDADLLSGCLEAALLGRKAELGSDELLIERVVRALRPQSGCSRGVQRSKIRAALRALLPSLNNASEAAALLFAYAWELVTNGTLLKQRAAPTTPYDYVSAICEGVIAEFGDSPISSLSDEEYGTKFSKLTQQLVGKRRPLASLRGFHRFLRSWWNAPVLRREVFGSESEPEVAANLVWEHELALVDTWLAAESGERVYAQARVALAAGARGAFRATELLVLRCKNVIVEGAHVVVEIARELSDGKEKTAAGRRKVVIEDPAAVQLLVSWLERRMTVDGALPGDYLFGEPDVSPTVHRRGYMYYLMNKLLKVATGDETVSFHTLRHTVVSRQLHRCWMARSDSEVDPAAQAAGDAGHVGVHVSARFYAHTFEEPIRDRIDRAVLANVSALSLASWLGRRHDAVRQTLSRSVRKMAQAGNADPIGARVGIIYDQFAQSLAASGPCILASLCESQPPTAPVFPGRKVASLLTVWRVLSDLASGLDFEVVALRQALSPACTRRVASLVGEFCERHGSQSKDRISLELHGHAALRDHAGTSLGVRVAFRADLINRLALPDACDSLEKLRLLRDACEYWSRNLHGDQLAATPDSSLLMPFLRTLMRMKIPATALSIRTSAPATRHAKPHVATDTVTAIQAAFGMSVPIVRTGERAGRCPAYLVISLTSQRPTLRGHGASILWFHSLLLAATVWVQLLNENSIDL